MGKETIRKHVLKNKLDHGSASLKAVMSKVLGEDSELRKDVKQAVSWINEEIRNTEKMSKEEILSELSEKHPELLAEKKEPEKHLPDLPGNPKSVVMRFAPAPSGPLHVGNARAAVVNDAYVKKIGGKHILRIEDTDPVRVLPEAYEMIEQDLAWLGVKWHEKVLQSDRFDRYLKVLEKLVSEGKAYVCLCMDKYREHSEKKKPCPCRSRGEKENLEMFYKMKRKEYEPGEAAVRLKTSMVHENISVRDYPVARVVDADKTPHPRLKNKYYCYPLFNLVNVVDDHDLGITHVLRGKDHEINTVKQAYIFDYMGWKPPHYLHYGLMSIDAKISKSKMKEKILLGEYDGWADPRTLSLLSLKRRGILAESLYEYLWGLGTKPVDVKFSLTNLYAINRKKIDPTSKRFFFVQNPVEILVKDCPEKKARLKLHPTEEMGFREYAVKQGENVFKVPEKEAALSEYRLKDLFNVKKTGKHYAYSGTEIKKVSKIQWVLGKGLEAKVLMPDGEKTTGVVEQAAEKLKAGEVVQFERFGFCRLEKKTPEMFFVYTHN